MKLISMTDYVLEQEKEDITDDIFMGRVIYYARFLKQPLELWMFVPCALVNGVWVPLEEPNINGFKSIPFCESGDCKAYRDEMKQYQQAKERVLFEGFSTIQQGENTIVMKGDFPVWLTWTKRDVEFLVQFTPTLTKTAINQFKIEI